MSDPVVPRSIRVPTPSLVVLIGASGSGKSTFARRHFLPTEVLSSDYFRGLVSDDENSQDATDDAFAALRFVAARRLARGRLVVIDATNVQPAARKPFVALAREHHLLPVAIVLNLPERTCHERNAQRGDRAFGPHVVRHQATELRRSLRRLRDEGFRQVDVLGSVEEIEAATIARTRLWCDRSDETGPFDIIGDIHGCFDELCDLLRTLGCALDEAADVDGRPMTRVTPAPDRRIVFLGDLVDRGPRTPDVLRLVMGMVEAGTAICVPGNHEAKLQRKLVGRDVKLTHGLAETVAQLAQEPPEFSQRVAAFIDGLVSHFVLDGGKLVVAHAGLPQSMHGRSSGAVRQHALYGDTTGETDEYGLPVRYPWADDYRGKATVVYGHVPVPEAEWVNGTICLDTGCVFGGQLTALRWPERELVSVPARQTWYEPARPLAPVRARSGQQESDDLLHLEDVMGRRRITTTLGGSVVVREENAAAALEVMSRFAADPRWLVHLPPTMSPPATSSREGLLEHPDEAFAYFREAGVLDLTCEEKHMGSRAIVIACRDEDAARATFGVASGERGIILSRTGRRFFDDPQLESALLERISTAIGAAGLWESLETGWICLDAELLPWSAKAQQLLKSQYAGVAAAAIAETSAAEALLSQGMARGLDVAALHERTKAGAHAALAFREAYRRYCWPVDGLDGLRVAPFHVLATEGRVHADRPHDWHLGIAEALSRVEPLAMFTRHHHVDLADDASVTAAVSWWTELTAAGGEGMVVKPRAFVARGRKGLVQPGIKCRGPEYLRLIYGPDYLAPEHLARLRSRGLAAKRGLALREFSLGIESLHRFVAREPLRRVHECVFAILAFESEPVDPRL